MCKYKDMKMRMGDSRFEAVDDGRVVGWLDFSVRPEGVAFTHTMVPERHSGQGVGTRLVEYALEQAATNRWGVLPACPFVRSYIVAHPEHLWLVPANQRDNYGL